MARKLDQKDYVYFVRIFGIYTYNIIDSLPFAEGIHVCSYLPHTDYTCLRIHQGTISIVYCISFKRVQNTENIEKSP